MAISEAQSVEERENREDVRKPGYPRQLIDLTAPIDLNSGQDLTLPPDWRNLTQVCRYWLLVNRSRNVD